MSMTKKDLLAVAEKNGVEIPSGATKADILELIEQARASEPQESEEQETEEE